MRSTKIVGLLLVLFLFCMVSFYTVENRHDVKLRQENAALKEQMKDFEKKTSQLSQVLSSVYPDQKETIDRIIKQKAESIKVKDAK